MLNQVRMSLPLSHTLSLVCLLLSACLYRYFSRRDPVTYTPADHRSPKRVIWVNVLKEMLANRCFRLRGSEILQF